MPGVLVLDPVQVKDSAGTNVLVIDSLGRLLLPAGAATEATLATLATETKLEAVRVLLASLDGKDFATETKLESVRVLLASLDGKDYATATAQVDRSQVAQSIGDVAHGSPDSGEPIKTGGVGTAAAPVAVDEGDRVQASFDLQGRARTTVRDEQFRELFANVTYLTVTHSLGLFPLNVKVLAEGGGGAGGFGLGGFGAEGFGELGGSGELYEYTNFLVRHVDENGFSVIFDSVQTGVVIYWV